MRNNIKLALFYILILGLFSILLCTENSIWFSASIAMICTSTGVCIGQLIKKRKRFHAIMGSIRTVFIIYHNFIMHLFLF